MPERGSEMRALSLIAACALASMTNPVTGQLWGGDISERRPEPETIQRGKLSKAEKKRQRKETQRAKLAERDRNAG